MSLGWISKTSNPFKDSFESSESFLFSKILLVDLSIPVPPGYPQLENLGI